MGGLQSLVPETSMQNDPHGEDHTEYYNETKLLLDILELLSLKDMLILLMLIEVLLVLLRVQYVLELLRSYMDFVLTRGMSSDEKPGTRNATPSTERNEPKPNFKVAGETYLTFRGAVDEIKNYIKDVENDTIPLILNDHLAAYPTTPEADVLPGRGMIEAV